MRRTCRLAMLGSVIGLAAGCAAPTPVLYPTARVQTTPAPAVQADVTACLEMAQAADLEGTGERAARSTAGGAIIGGATGGAVGAVFGDAGRGAAAGAAGGAAQGLMRGLLGWRQPSPTFKRYVERCLAEKGYEVVGWE